EATHEVLVQRVGEDRVTGPLVRRVPADEVVPRLLGVEHRRVELATRLDTGVGERLGGDAGLDVAELGEVQRVREALGRVDGVHEHAPTEVDRGLGRGGGRGRRLADAAGTAVDDDLLCREELLERREPFAVARPWHQVPSSSPSASATSWVARTP